MIRLDRVELLHWDMQPHQVLPLAGGVTLITGENGSGKTSILDALKVGLGVSRLDGERTIEGYLLSQAAPVAMIRILVDNRPEPGTRRRPFDPLGEHSEDVVTLALVFRADQDGGYLRSHYILDGDVVPLDELAGPNRSPWRPLPSARDYRERLKRVGIGRQYLKLLSLPQGQIANLCRLDADRLFDSLFDIIGGRDALENWEKRLAELNEKQREQEQVKRELDEARRSLGRLESAVRQFHAFQDALQRRADHRDAIPHVALSKARGESEKLVLECQRLESELDNNRKRAEALDTQMSDVSAARQMVEGELDLHKQKLDDLGMARDATYEHFATWRARLDELDRVRAAAQHIKPEDLDTLEAAEESSRVSLARGQTEAARRADERAGLEDKLDRVRKGLIPFPDEVEPFRQALRQAGIAHHVLAEVLEVTNAEWTRAVEGFLGRYRFAILVQDPTSWARAARLAREHAYPHGVLAPDVRSYSPADDEGLGKILEVREPRYAQLIARLVRHVQIGELPDPLEPPRKVRHLTDDGFLLTRIEAHHAPAHTTYLGRAALQERRAELERALEDITLADEEWRVEQTRLRLDIRALQRRIDDQKKRLAWESVRDEHALASEKAAEHAGKVEALDEARKTANEQLDSLRTRFSRHGEELAVIGTQSKALIVERREIETSLEKRRRDRELAGEQLGALLADPLPELTEGAAALTELELSVIQATATELERQLEHFSDVERDPMLPLNYDRQKAEVAAVESRLQRLDSILDETRSTAEEARDHYRQTTRRVFRAYFARLREAGQTLDFHIDGRLEERESGRFACELRIQVGDKSPVGHDSDKLSGGQKAALSILMSMTAVSLESESAGFFLIDEPFSQSDIQKINELGDFLRRSGAQYLVSMPTSSDLESCGSWLEAVWICTRSRGGFDEEGRLILAQPVRINFAHGARRAHTTLPA